MKFILIMVWIASSSINGTAQRDRWVELATQEFDDKPACEAAAVAINKIQSGYARPPTASCVPKGAARRQTIQPVAKHV